MLIYKKFVFNPFSENTFVLWDKTTFEALVIDPGCYSGEEESELERFLIQNKLNLKYILNTHCHLDHVFGNAFLKAKFNSAKLILAEEEVTLLKGADKQSEMFGLTFNTSPLPDEILTEQTEIFLGKMKVVPLFTPGHTFGEYSFLVETNNICFTGDVLFCESIGRTDLWGGNQAILIESIRGKLFNLPDETVILPGHGEETTISHEKKYNPFM